MQNFNELALNNILLTRLQAMAFEQPTPIQEAAIPVLLQGKDILAQAQTGTGKTAAFALPMLQNLDLAKKGVQYLVLAPTRELAIQVAEAIIAFSQGLKGVVVATLYGGGDYKIQLNALKKGANIVVGTPGRVIDHINRKTLHIENLQGLVLDEADEMLKMGFIDDVETILAHTPKQKQSALFSATMPKAIKQLAYRYLNSPEEIIIKQKTLTVERINQYYLKLYPHQKIEALSRLLEFHGYEAIIIFVRTKSATEEVAESLIKRGLKAQALHGDIAQTQRKRTVEALKRGDINIIVATDVAARGIDIERVSCVVNYDIPFDPETYVHRIGRTGRAGREGDAYLFISSNERHLLRRIESLTKQTIAAKDLPAAKQINEKRIERFMDKIQDSMNKEARNPFYDIVEKTQQKTNCEWKDLAVTLAYMLQDGKPFFAKELEEVKDRGANKTRKKGRDFVKTKGFGRMDDGNLGRFRIEVGRKDGVSPGNIVGAIANEAGLDSRHIGRIQIHDRHSFVDLPAPISRDALKVLKKAWICGKQMNLSEAH